MNIRRTKQDTAKLLLSLLYSPEISRKDGGRKIVVNYRNQSVSLVRAGAVSTRKTQGSFR